MYAVLSKFNGGEELVSERVRRVCVRRKNLRSVGIIRKDKRGASREDVEKDGGRGSGSRTLGRDRGISECTTFEADNYA